MKVVIVDTNIIFSALLSNDNAIRKIIVDLQTCRFFTSDYLRVELKNHHTKLKKSSKLTDEDIATSQYQLFKYITFIALDIIPEHYWLKAEQLVANVDVDDIPFVALALYLDAYLWTGDKILYNGLKAKGFEKVVSTQELKILINRV
jgi:predicted nucleic acid-binding protein